jgi:outer membrane receptor protein involved in Fe transport
VLNVIQTFPGVLILGNKIQVRGNRDTPLLVIDDMPYADSDDDEYSLLSSINVNEVEYVNLLKGVDASIYGSRGGNGVIIIRLKSGADFTSHPVGTPGLAIVKPLGYYHPAQFYSPIGLYQELNGLMNEYNSSVKNYNVYYTIFPHFIFAKRKGFKRDKYLTIEYGKENQDPIEKSKEVPEWAKNVDTTFLENKEK